MKTLLLILTLAFQATAQQDRIILVPEKSEKPAPLFFSAAAEITATASTTETTSTQKITYTIVQGVPETLSLSLKGSGEVISLTGKNLRDWSVRVSEDGSRFLDVRPLIPDRKNPPKTFTVTLITREKTEGKSALLIPGPPSTGFSASISLSPTPGTELRVTEATGLSPIESGTTRRYLATTASSLKFSATPTGTASRGLELLDTSLTGKVSQDSQSITFTLTATGRANGGGLHPPSQTKPPVPETNPNPQPEPQESDPSPSASIRGSSPPQPQLPEAEKPRTLLLTSPAAITSSPSNENYHIALTESNTYDLIADTTGDFPIEIEFVVPITRNGDWNRISFALPAGVVVPITLTGLPEAVIFDRDLSIVPRKSGGDLRSPTPSSHTGFLPASGKATLAFKSASATADGSLFFTSHATTDVRIGSGLLRQFTGLDIRVLQGKLPSLSLALQGPGEILSVSGDSVLAWSVAGENEDRRIEIKLSRPIEGSERIIIEAQAALAGFPVKMQALRISPTGTLRHSGFLRVANDGAVRIEVADAKGLIQLAPDQFPGGANDALRQVFVYRFPSADFSYKLQADQILPEVGVTEVTVYELAETDRRIISDLELDIREAPLREWEMSIPADHAVASVTGAEVADYAVASEATDGSRTLKIIFKQPVINRQLVSIRLEKNEAAKAEPWILQPLGFPDVKSRRGYIGAVATAGYRLVAGETTGVAEVPVTFFPRKTPGLQQAFRLRETEWAVSLDVEALGQSIQADVFHLYSLKAGAAYGSVLINYFVVGAPATEWKISVPAAIGNIDVTGQNVGRDWRRDGDTVIVPLSRPLLGAGTVLLTFEQPMPSTGGELSPGEVRPLDVQAERGYVQVVSPLQVKFSAPVSEGPLLKIDPSELPAEFRLLSSAPTLAAWQYTARDFTIGAVVEWFEQGETVDQVVDFLKLSTQISRDGQWVTDAKFFVKSKGRAALRAILPTDSLWEARVDGTPVNAREDGKETLIPLPARTDPNRAVEIALRYGPAPPIPTTRPSPPPSSMPLSSSANRTVTGDENRVLVASGGGLHPPSQASPSTGWQTLTKHRPALLILLLLGVLTMWRRIASAQPGKTSSIVSATASVLFILIAIALAMKTASSTHFTSPSTLSFNAPVVPAGETISVEIANIPHWRAHTSLSVWLLFLAGTTITVVGLFKKGFIWKFAGLALVAASFLSIRGGTPLFFLILALIAAASIPWRRILSAMPTRKPVTTALILLTAIAFVNQAQAREILPAESITQTWKIQDNRLQASMEITLRAEEGDRFLLLDSPATLTSFSAQGLKVTKERRTERGLESAAKPKGEDGGLKSAFHSYILTATTSGKLSATATYEMPLPTPSNPWQVPTGPAAVRKIDVRYDQPGWQFISPAAAKTTPLAKLNDNESGATMFFGPAIPSPSPPGRHSATLRPKRRNSSPRSPTFSSPARA